MGSASASRSMQEGSRTIKNTATTTATHLVAHGLVLSIVLVIVPAESWSTRAAQFRRGSAKREAPRLQSVCRPLSCSRLHWRGGGPRTVWGPPLRRGWRLKGRPPCGEGVGGAVPIGEAWECRRGAAASMQIGASSVAESKRAGGGLGPSGSVAGRHPGALLRSRSPQSCMPPFCQHLAQPSCSCLQWMTYSGGGAPPRASCS